MKPKLPEQKHNLNELSPQAKAHGLALARLLLDSVLRDWEGKREGDTEEKTGNLHKIDE